MPDVKRLQYFDHQFLRLADFTDEQDYHRRLRRVHNSTLHTPGISSGLDVTVDQGSTHVTVAAGAAVDADGRDIVLDSAEQVELGGLPADQDAYVVISYAEQSTDPSSDGGGDTRFTEHPHLEGMTSAPTDGQHLVLARVTRQGTTVQPNPDVSVRRAAGVAAGDLSVNSLHLRAPNVVASAWPGLSATAANTARLDGSLTLTGALAAPNAQLAGGALTVASADVDGSLTVDVANANAGARAPGITFGSGSGEGIASTRQAGGTNRFGLDLFTNSTSRLTIDNAGHVGIGIRTPGVALDVAGTLRVTGGTITPAIGNSAGAGIEFPNNPGGGAADEAYIRYYADPTPPGAVAETTTLTIGVANDADDRIELVQAGSQRLTVFNGNVGIGTRTPAQKLDVNGYVALNGKDAFHGDDPWLRLNQTGAFTSGVHTPGVLAPGQLNVGGQNGWGAPGGGNMWVAGSAEIWGGLTVHGDTRLGADDRFVFIGGNQTGRFIQFHDDLWFSDPQTGAIQLRNANDSNWGTLAGFFASMCSAELKTDINALDAGELGTLLGDALKLDVVRFKYRGEDEETGRERYGIIAEEAPSYLLGVDGQSVHVMEYAAMLHGALKALAAEVEALKSDRPAKPATTTRKRGGS